MVWLIPTRGLILLYRHQKCYIARICYITSYITYKIVMWHPNKGLGTRGTYNLYIALTGFFYMTCYITKKKLNYFLCNISYDGPDYVQYTMLYTMLCYIGINRLSIKNPDAEHWLHDSNMPFQFDLPVPFILIDTPAGLQIIGETPHISSCACGVHWSLPSCSVQWSHW